MSKEQYFENEVDFAELIGVLWNKKKLIFLVTMAFSIIGVIYSLSLPNIYSSSAVLASNKTNSMSSNLNQYAGLASMAGISIPSSGEVDDVALGIEVMKSYKFFEDFVIKNEILLPLIASKKWDASTNQIIFDKNIYDSDKKKWVSESKYAIDGKLSIQFAHRHFIENQFNISRDNDTDFVTISFRHHSPFFAKRIIDLLIYEMNEQKRNDDITIALKSISFLEEEIQQSQLSEVKSGLNNLIQKQIEQVVLAKVTQEYLFKTASPAFASEKKSAPSRALICIIFFIFGFFFSALYATLHHYNFFSLK